MHYFSEGDYRGSATGIRYWREAYFFKDFELRQSSRSILTTTTHAIRSMTRLFPELATLNPKRKSCLQELTTSAKLLDDHCSFLATIFCADNLACEYEILATVSIAASIFVGMNAFEEVRFTPFFNSSESPASILDALVYWTTFFDMEKDVWSLCPVRSTKPFNHCPIISCRVDNNICRQEVLHCIFS